MNTLIAISGLGIFCLFAEIINLRKLLLPISIFGLLVILGITLQDINTTQSFYNNMIVVNNYSVLFSSAFILITIFILLMSNDFYKNRPTKFSDFIAIKIFLLSGGVAMVSFGNLSMFFVGIEILSISLYVLAGSERLNLKSNEAGMKYFLMGAFASGILLFGICLIYGATGYFDIAEIKELSQGAGLPAWFPVGIALLLIGMFFKIAAAPFHFWAPDVYQGSPALTTATMSTLAKIIAVATLYKLMDALLFNLEYHFQIVILVVAILSMFVGNIMALKQDNVKRMLAFSGISHAGFMMIPLLISTNGADSLLYYTLAYALAGIAAFAIIICVCRDKGDENVSLFNGLAKSHPLLAAILTASLLSMAGIPIFSGFFAKFVLFTQAIEAGYLILVIVGVINSIISMGYYFKIIIAMYTKETPTETITVPVAYYIVAVLGIVLNIALGVYPGLLPKI